ncbi:unnamed protein product, partial [Cercopithifilaria johnstoni]
MCERCRRELRSALINLGKLYPHSESIGSKYCILQIGRVQNMITECAQEGYYLGMRLYRMPESSKQCESIHIPTRSSRHPLLCVECHKRFPTMQELYLHSEVCIIESFENEAINVFSSMPSLTEPATAFVATAHAGITAKGDDPPILVPETSASANSSGSTSLSLPAKHGAECSLVKKTERMAATETSKTAPISLMSTSESEQRSYWIDSCFEWTKISYFRSHKLPFELENAQILQSPGGLRIYVSIERQCGRGSDGIGSGNDGGGYEFQ